MSNFRLASSTSFSSSLGIKDPIHKQKLSLKAMDVVLFGPPKHHNYVKDVILVLSLVLAIGGCWFAFVQHKYSQTHLKKMLKDMDSLQKAEEQLMSLQTELDKARHDQETARQEKQSLEQRLKREIAAIVQKKESDMQSINRDLSTANESGVRMLELEDELRETQDMLEHARSQLMSANKSWVAPDILKHWLQLTHELEMKNYNGKRHAAELQLASAKDGVCTMVYIRR